jgi:hypothetical protein
MFAGFGRWDRPQQLVWRRAPAAAMRQVPVPGTHQRGSAGRVRPPPGPAGHLCRLPEQEQVDILPACQQVRKAQELIGSVFRLSADFPRRKPD